MKQPLPGQIWELNRSIQTPLELSPQDEERLYPETARRFLAGEGLPRYALIVKEPEKAIAERPGGLLAPEEPWSVLWVMLLSPDTDRLSDIDILIPSAISGMERDLLALTWQVLPMLSCNLSRSVGRRLSRSVYDALWNCGNSHRPNFAEIESLGLRVGKSDRRQSPEMQEFYRRESEFAAVLEVPVATYRRYEKAIAISEVLLDMALEVEREFVEEEGGDREAIPSDSEIASLHSVPLAMTGRVNLSKWLEDIVESGWQKLEDIPLKPPDAFAFNFRSVKPKTKGNAKLLELGDKPDTVTVALSVELTPSSDSEELDITVEVYAIEGDLPPGLQLILLDELGEKVSEVTARVADIGIQQELSGFPGEEFSVKIVLGESSIIEYFEV